MIKVKKIKTLGAIFFSCLLMSTAHASKQQYEQMKEETRQVLSHSVADIAPEINSFSTASDQQRWVNVQGELLKSRIPNEYERVALLKSIHYEATRAGLEPELILGLIEVESSFRKYAISYVGAKGLMQVMPFWIKEIGKPDDNLFHARVNLRYGNVILKHYLDREKGNMFMALGRYNGSLGKSKYPNAVQRAAKKYRDALKRM